MTTAFPPTITDGTVTLTWGPAGQYYGYCTIADVLLEFNNSPNMVKALDRSVVAQKISYTAINSIDSTLGLYYEMPYTGDPLGRVGAVLREINTFFACVQVIDRYMAANDTVSPLAALYQHRAGALIEDITNGVIRLSDPFGDAVPMPDLPVYPRASMISVSPNPTLHRSQRAVFTMDRPQFRRRMAF